MAQARFGAGSLNSKSKGLQRIAIRLENSCSRIEGHHTDHPAQEAIPVIGSNRQRSTLSLIEEPLEETLDDEEETSGSEWKPNIQLTFSSSNVFAGLRKTVEEGAIDGKKMPGWMTGENGVSVGAVRGGRMRGDGGSGIW